MDFNEYLAQIPPKTSRDGKFTVGKLYTTPEDNYLSDRYEGLILQVTDIMERKDTSDRIFCTFIANPNGCAFDYFDALSPVGLALVPYEVPNHEL